MPLSRHQDASCTSEVCAAAGDSMGAFPGAVACALHPGRHHDAITDCHLPFTVGAAVGDHLMTTPPRLSHQLWAVVVEL